MSDKPKFKLPNRVYKTKTSYYFKNHENKTITIGSIEMTQHELFTRYNEIIHRKIEVRKDFRTLFESFLKSSYFLELKPRTQTDYYQHQKKLLAVFGDMEPAQIKTEHVRLFMDKRGEQSRTQANHELSSMSKVFRWGYERGYVKFNPCVGVSKYPVKHRDIYVTDEEYYAIYHIARPAVQIAMELAYLCAMRLGDILALTWAQVLPNGLLITQSKTGKKQLKAYNERLLDALDFARAQFPPKNGDSHLILNGNNEPYQHKTFNMHWLVAKRQAEIELNKELNCTFHDLKAKAISDFEGSSRDKQLFSGHKTENQVLIYDRKLKISPTLNLPKIEKK